MKSPIPRQLLYQFLLFILAIMGVVFLIQGLLLLYIRNQETLTAQTYIESMVNSVEHTITTNLQNLERAGFALSYNSDLMQIYSQQQDVRTSITGVLELIKLIYYDNQGDVLDVALVGLDGSQRSLLMGVSPEMNTALMGMYNFGDKNKTDRRFLFFKPDSAFRDSYYIYVAPLLNYTGPEGGANNKLATIVFTGELTSIKRAMSVVEPADVILWITDEEEQLVLSNAPGFSIQEQATPWLQSKITFSKEIFDTHLKLTGAVMNHTSIESQQIVQYMLFSMFVFIATLLITFLFIRGKISIPMNLLRKDIEQVGRQGLSRRVKLYDSAEIDAVASWINTMLGRLEKTTEENNTAQQKIYKIEILKKHAELYSLRNQINPHFLYNTLQCMRGIAIENDVPDLADMATALFEIFRYAIKGGDQTSIQKEMFVARQYLHIFEFRFQGNFEYEIEADDDVMELSIIKMTLQPIIENSIQHGFSNHQGKMRIHIRLYRENDSVNIRITDNGDGIAPERLQEIQSLLAQDDEDGLESEKLSSFGLDNINRRLKLTYGAEYYLEITNLAQGTQVKITIPAIEYHHVPE
jgi:two-component system, sensor histidine kinase YesM